MENEHGCTHADEINKIYEWIFEGNGSEPATVRLSTLEKSVKRMADNEQQRADDSRATRRMVLGQTIGFVFAIILLIFNILTKIL